MSAAPPSTFFRSRWVDAPAGVRELPTGLPKGFRASGVAAGIKASGNLDVGLMVCDAPDATSAARFTRSSTAAAPVLLCRERAQLHALRAVAVNSGNANAATGGRGRDDAAKMQGAAAIAAGVPHDRVAVASTGVIGVPLDTHAIVSGLARAAAGLRPDGDADFTAAIMTTDAFEKRATLDLVLPSGGAVRLSAQAKGAGMIQPSHATMLCFVQTDAALSAETADL
ncbi:MAG: glutamate N-acetyltransferase / amino-acid N-acetyltransferase, partial [Solirubrobacteraceae bacterium]|nr:glutamate N-acetyltransferase / amino-acid N-acetyltransferase [Solirubrobacteraceae bacterium]